MVVVAAIAGGGEVHEEEVDDDAELLGGGGGELFKPSSLVRSMGRRLASRARLISPKSTLVVVVDIICIRFWSWQNKGRVLQKIFPQDCKGVMCLRKSSFVTSGVHRYPGTCISKIFIQVYRVL